MSWVVFMYSVGGQSSSPRVTVWRRLQRLGAISPRSGVHVLPDTSDCQESLQWLAREVQQLNGESLIMKVAAFEGLSDQELTDLYRDQSRTQYKELEELAGKIGKRAGSKLSSEDRLQLRSEITRLRRKHSEVSETDFFQVPEGMRVGALISSIEQRLSPNESDSPSIEPVSTQDFQRKIWVTRPRPHVDRLACAWLIRKFIDPKAKICYKDEPEKTEIAFDMKRGGRFGHVGSLCTFEVMVRSFSIEEPAVKTVSEIIHQLDVKDGAYWHPESLGIEAVLSGWRLSDMTDLELESHGIALFEGLYCLLNSRKETNTSECVFRAKMAMVSGGKWPRIPVQNGQGFRTKMANF